MNKEIPAKNKEITAKTATSTIAPLVNNIPTTTPITIAIIIDTAQNPLSTLGQLYPSIFSPPIIY